MGVVMKMLFECECGTRISVSANSKKEATYRSYPDFDMLGLYETKCSQCGKQMRHISWPRMPAVLYMALGGVFMCAGFFLHYRLHQELIAIVPFIAGGLFFLLSLKELFSFNRIDSREDGLRWW
jgi:hypothetical protein